MSFEAILQELRELEKRMATKFDHLDAVTAALASAVTDAANEISTLLATLASANARDDSADIETRANAIQAIVDNLKAAIPAPVVVVAPAPVVAPVVPDPAPVAPVVAEPAPTPPVVPAAPATVA